MSPLYDSTDEADVKALISRLQASKAGAEVLSDELLQLIGREVNRKLTGPYVATISQSGHLLLFQVNWSKLAPYVEREHDGALWCSKDRFESVRRLMSTIRGPGQRRAA